jgi:hypothetical protein
MSSFPLTFIFFRGVKATNQLYFSWDFPMLPVVRSRQGHLRTTSMCSFPRSPCLWRCNSSLGSVNGRGLAWIFCDVWMVLTLWVHGGSWWLNWISWWFNGV